MNIQSIIFLVLIALSSTSCHPPTRHILEPVPESILSNSSITTSDYVPTAHQDTHSIICTRMKRSQIRKISVSPEPAPPPYIKPENSTKPDNSTTTTTMQQPSPRITSWIPPLEDIVTPIFRAVLLVLTLFNVNISWRIHGRIHGQWLSLPLHSLGLGQS